MVDVLHLRGGADQGAEAVAGFELLAQHPVFAFELQATGAGGQQAAHFLGLERLGDVVGRAELHGLHGGAHGGMRGHENHRELGRALFRLFEQIEAVHVGEGNVGQEDVDGALIQQG